MAIIGKIREKSWLLLIVVGGALVTFIFTSQGPNFGGDNEEKYGIGLLYGEKVDDTKFNDMVREAEVLAQQNADRSGQPAQPVNMDGVWQRFIEKELLAKEYEALGIHVGEDEFDAYLYGRNGFEPPADLKGAFVDENGNFDPKKLQDQIQQLQNSKEPKDKEVWEQSKRYYTEQRERQKYFDILSQGMYVTKLEAKHDYVAKNEKKSITFVVRNYNEIDDKQIPVNDKLLKAYFEAHKNEPKYKNRVSEHVIRWADIMIQPSKADSMEFEKKLKKIQSDFALTKKDSAFVIKNSDSRFYSSKVGYRPEGSQNSMAQQGFTYPAIMDTAFLVAKVGDIVGPYDQQGSTMIAKVISKGPLLSVRHILIGAQRADTLAVAKAKITTDSIMKVINKDNFEEYVTKYSTDQGSVEKGGKYEDFLDGEMVPEFGDFAKDEPVGKIGYVQTDFGFHIIEVLDRKADVVPYLAVVQKTLKPGIETLDELQKTAYELLEKMYAKIDKISDPYKKVAMFDTLAMKVRKDMLVRPLSLRDESPKVSGFNTPYAENELLKLAYKENAKVGDLVSSPIKDGDRWVVAILADIRVKNEVSFENSRRTVEYEYIQNEKAKRLMDKMKGKSLEKIAEEGTTIVQDAEVTFGSSQLGRIASEPEIIGALFSGLKDGKMTQPLKGKAGVYVIKIGKTVSAPQTTNYEEERKTLLTQARGQISSTALAALKDQAEIIDNRKLREIGVRR